MYLLLGVGLLGIIQFGLWSMKPTYQAPRMVQNREYGKSKSYSQNHIRSQNRIRFQNIIRSQNHVNS